MHRHSGAVHQIDYGTRVRGEITTEVGQECIGHTGIILYVNHIIRKGGNHSALIPLYAPCLERTHIDGAAYLTRVTEHIAVVLKIDNMIINSIFKQSR